MVSTEPVAGQRKTGSRRDTAITQMVYTRKLRIDEAQLPEIIAANTKWFIRGNEVVV